MDNWQDAPLNNVRRIHFIGIGGAGMSGIAEVLTNLGYDVSGSDQSGNQMTRHLDRIGCKVYLQHDPDQVLGADVVVYSSAIPADNVELLAAKEHRIPTVPRAEMLAELMRFRRGIAVAGTHGKTTTTSLIASVLAEGGLDPTFVIGGLVHGVDSHARLGSGDFLVAEADESDASFLLLNPLIAVLTNIDLDHMETYGGDFDRLQSSFVEFFRRLPFYGVAVVCLDDPNAEALIPELRCRVVTYGTHPDADVRGYAFSQHGPTGSFKVALRSDADPISVTLNMPGHHNMLNSLAAIAVGTELRVAPAASAAALASFQGIGRRCQWLGDAKIGGATVSVIDDYGHHPTEIKVTLQAVRDGWPGRRLVVVFQPHRYTRTRDLFEDFVEVLSGADVLALLDVYAAGERPIAGADGRALCRSIRLRGEVDPVFIAENDRLIDILVGLVRDGDIVLLLGAGSIGRVSETIDLADPDAGPAIVSR